MAAYTETVAVRFLPSLALSAVAAFTAAPLSAAVPYGRGALAIVVRDAKGQPVAGAAVTAAGPVTRQGTTIGGGLLVLQALPLGIYAVSVTKAGFAPLSATANVKAATSTIQSLAVRLAAADFSSASEAAAVQSTEANPADDPFVAHALAAAPGVDVVPGGILGGSAAALQGTTPLESRIELDGIPLARGASAGLRFRTPLVLDAVDVTPGLATAPRYTAQGTIGGVVNFRTRPIADGPQAAAQGGYDSSFGSFQRARFSQTIGPLGVATDLLTGGGETRAQVLKLRYAFSGTTSLAIASYGSQSSARSGTDIVTNVAPAAALDLRTGFGAATFEARTYRSGSRSTDAAAAPDGASDDRLTGTQLNFDLPAGSALLSLGFDRRTEREFASAANLERTESALTARAVVPLPHALRLELADAYGGGTQLRRRHDPQAAVTLGAGKRLSVRLAAGSAFATLPLDTLAALPVSERVTAPETSFGYRATANLQLGGGDRLWAAAFAQRRYDVLAALSQARSRGLEFGFERAALGGGFGALAYVDVQRAFGFGGLQPFARAFLLPSLAGEQIAGDGYSKARLAFSYRLPETVALRIGSTFLGANNAFTGRAFALADASLAVSLGSLVQARIGVENAFGHPIADPILASEYAPHEFTFSLGRR